MQNLEDNVRRVAVFGGVYNNYLSLEAVLTEARARGASEIYCLGDIGGFGPHPNRVFPLLCNQPDIFIMQGNYDHSVGNGLEDCGCGYTDPADNYFAQISYDYTLANTDPENRRWLRDLPTFFRRQWAGKRVLMAHGSPRRVNEFLWESTTSDAFLEYLLDDFDADILFITHTGIPWQRTLSGGKQVINVGAIGRPANNGLTSVDYMLVDIGAQKVNITMQSVHYDHLRLVKEMREEGLPEQFCETLLTGYWTTCLEIMPARERAAGKY